MLVTLTRSLIWAGLLVITSLYGWGMWNYALPGLLAGVPIGIITLVFVLPGIYIATWALWSAWKAGLRAAAPKFYQRLEDIPWLPL